MDVEETPRGGRYNKVTLDLSEKAGRTSMGTSLECFGTESGVWVRGWDTHVCVCVWMCVCLLTGFENTK